MFLIIYKYIKPIEVVDQYVVAHRAYLDTCYQNDCFVVSGPKNPRTGAVLLSQLNDREQLEKVLQADPFVVHQVVEYEVSEFLPIKHHKHFSHFISA